MPDHTAGPWFFDNKSCVRSSRGAPIARALSWPSPLEFVPNSLLIAAAPDLLRATRKALPLLEDHLRTLIESHCLLDRGTRAPMRDTIDEDVKSDVEQLERCINDLRDALAKAEGRNV